jgi:hypothetical protein
MVIDDKALRADITFHFFQGLQQAGMKSGIVIGHVAIKRRLVLQLYLFDAVQEYVLVHAEVRYVFGHAPFIGVYPPAQLLFIETFDELMYGFVLVLKAGKY